MASMEAIIVVFIFILGTLVGSFLNVVILRFGTDLEISNGRSKCLKCGVLIKWFDNIPVLSFILLGGKCGGCKENISWQYPLVEVATGFLFVAGAGKIGLLDQGVLLSFPVILNSIFLILIMSLLIIIFVYDLYHKIIPDVFSYSFAFLSFVGLIYRFWPNIFTYPNYLDLLAGPILFLPFYLLWKFSQGRLIGLGDGKLALGMGWFLGLAGGVSAVILAFWIGAVVSLSLLAIGKIFESKGWLGKLRMKSEVPFGPFLIVGTLVAYFWEVDLLGLALFV